MNLRTIVIGILLTTLILPFLSLPLVTSSQTTATSTTMTIAQPPSQGQCAILTLAFSAHTGEQIIGTYGSDVSINFYILSQTDLGAIQNCRLEPSARPIFIEEKSVGHNNPYRSLSFPTDGIYYFVFMFVRGPTQLTKGYATIELSYPSSVVILGSTGSASISMTSTVVSVTSTSSVISLSTSSTLTSSATSTSPSSTASTTVTPAASTSTSVVTETSAPSGFSIFGFEMPLTSLLMVVAVIVVAVGGLIGATLFRNSKRRTLSNYLARIDSTFNEFAVDREECRTRLETLKSDVIEMLNKGKIDEGHFLMLDEKISEYLKELIQATPKYKRTTGTDDGIAAGPADRGTSVDQFRYCSNCGAKIPLDDKVCKKCGATQ